MFKICPCCKKEWPTVQDFVRDTNIEIRGYQANFTNPLEGYFLFTHLPQECRSTFTIKAAELSDLNPLIRELSQFKPGNEGCLGYCKEVNNLQQCTNSRCPGTHIRKIINAVKEKRGQ